MISIDGRRVIPDRCEPASHLYIAVPAYGGQVTAECTHSLCESAMLLERAGVKVEFDFGLGNCYLDHVRNQLATRFCRAGASDLLFVDADVSFEPAAILKIAAVRRPFVAGIYPMKSGDGSTQFPVWFDAEELWSGADGLIEAARVPTGFLRLNRGVMQAMADTTYDDGIINFFRTGVRDGRYYGEDIDFCDRWRALGGKIHIIPELTFGHSGMKRWTGSWGEWMRSRLPKGEAA